MNTEKIVIDGVDFRYYNDVSVLVEPFILNDNSTKEALYNIRYKRKLENAFNGYVRESSLSVNHENIQSYFKMNGLTELILKTTDECNLRCKYCVYSDHYPYTSKYSTNRMQLPIAIKAVDYYLDLVLQQGNFITGKRPFIAFYGGEPLLNFKLIQGTIDHIKEKYPGIEVNYTITTNGLSLQNPEISNYLKSNNVILCLSIDGYEENHDRNRLKVNGGSTFKEIEKIISDFFAEYPFIYSLCCIDYRTDLKKLFEHYMANDRINGGHIPHLLRVSQIFDIGTDYYDQFTESDKKSFISGLQWLEDLYIKLAKNGHENWFLDLMIGQEFMRLYDRPKFSKGSGYYYLNSCCLPGEKIYVYPNGDFGICEKVGIEDLVIGNVETGLDFKVITNIINTMNRLMYSQCKDCGISSLCTVCYAQLTSTNEIGFSESMCENRKKSIFHKLSTIFEIEAKNPQYFKEKVQRIVERNLNAQDTKEALLNIMLS